MALLGLQLATLVLWSQTDVTYRPFSIGASVLSLLVALVICILSYLEHRRSVRPSSLLSGYLGLAILLDLAQARSLWIRGNLDQIAGVFVASLGVKTLLVLLEEVPKKPLLPAEPKSVAPETTNGVFSRILFWWLNSVFVRGYRTLIKVQDVPVLDEKFRSETLSSTVAANWSTSRFPGGVL